LQKGRRDLAHIDLAEPVQQELKPVLQAFFVGLGVLPLSFVRVAQQGFLKRKIGDDPEMVFHEAFLLPLPRQSLG
tara:strand:+ start:3829 stop:4053 length:225 start_codon:yes stop_codon:yes gene_type:complete